MAVALTLTLPPAAARAADATPPTVAPAQTQPHRLSFTEAARLALAQTPEMLQSRARVAEAKGAVKAARGHLLPKLSASLTGTDSDNALNVFGMKLSQRKATFNDFGAGEFNPANPNVLSIAPQTLNHPGWYRNYGTQLQLDIPVYNGGKIWGFIDKAGAYLEAARKGNEAARQRLLFEVLKAYEGVRTARAFAQVARQGEKAAKSYVKVTNDLFRRGVVSKVDQLRAQLNLGGVHLKVIEAENHLQGVRDQLRVLTGLPASEALAVDQAVMPRLPETGLANLRRQALTDNPGIAALKQQLRAAQAGVRIARADYLPHFNLMVRREWNNDTLGGGSPSSTVAGVLSWDLFDFGSRRGGLDQAQARTIQSLAAARQAKNQLLIQVDKSWRDVRLAQERVRVRRLAIDQAREAARLGQLRYTQGVDTLTRLLAAQAELDQARGELVAARYQEVMQRAGLLLALGKLRLDALSVQTAPPPNLP